MAWRVVLTVLNTLLRLRLLLYAKVTASENDLKLRFNGRIFAHESGSPSAWARFLIYWVHLRQKI